jgi:hypothetical protein
MLPHKHGTDGFFAAVFERKAAKPAAVDRVDLDNDVDTDADSE